MDKVKKQVTDDEDDYKVDADKVRERMKATESDMRWWKPKPNTKSVVRVLPPWGKSAGGAFFFTGSLHYNFQIGGQNRAIPCLKSKDIPERCLVCEFIEALKNSGSSEMLKIFSGSKGIRNKRKYWVNLVDRKYPEEVKMYGTSRKFIEMIQSAIEDPDYGDITDVNDGHDIKITRVGAGFTDTKYTFTVRPKPSPLGLDDWKEKIHKLDVEVIEWIPLPEVAKIVRENFSDEMQELGFKIIIKGEKLKKRDRAEEEEEEEDDEDGEEEERPRKKTKKKVVEEVEEEEEEDEEEEETPKKKKAKDEDEDEDEEEED